MTSLTRQCAWLSWMLAGCIALVLMQTKALAQSLEVCRSGKPVAYVILPEMQGPTRNIVAHTLNGYLQRSYNWQLPVAQELTQAGSYFIVGNPENNATLRNLVARGLQLDEVRVAGEGFQILTHEIDQRRLIILYAKTPLGLKHACQELMYYRMTVTQDAASVDWPLNVTMNPAVTYRACYMLPCWSAYDSLDSWRRTLEFNSELTLNRNWFWLNGFPLLPKYGGIYQGSELGDLGNVRSLIELTHSEGMKFFVGGGWFTWHHKESASGSANERVARVGAGGGEKPIELDEQGMAAGVQYYLDLIAALPGADGLYIEPTGEGAQADRHVWSKHVEALDRLLKQVQAARPEFESAIAIGRFNTHEYREGIHRIAPDKLYWFWAWGNPLDDKVLQEHPLVLRWHTTQRMSSYHGSSMPPEPSEASLSGMVTSWDPGMGFGNPWNGWAKIGVDHPRNFHPYTMPYFSHQYWFRERCWNLDLTPAQFAQRLSKRLFDADMPEESIQLYLALAAICPQPASANAKLLAETQTFVRRYATNGTARNRDTLQRMQEAIEGIKAAK